MTDENMTQASADNIASMDVDCSPPVPVVNAAIEPQPSRLIITKMVRTRTTVHDLDEYYTI